MNIINQSWEKRNLGLNCIELRFSMNDTITDLDNELIIDSDVDYIQATVPINKMDISYELQKRGFAFAETKISLATELSNLKIPEIFQRSYERVKYHLANDDELKLIYSNLKKGLFDTDRFSLDPMIGKIKSGNRYFEWCRNEVIDKTSDAYIVYYKDRAIGFFVLKIEDKEHAYGLMGGLFDKEKDSGKGFSVLYPPMELAKKYNCSYIVTGVSSNNISSIRMHLFLGYKIQDLSYIFIKHMNKN